MKSASFHLKFFKKQVRMELCSVDFLPPSDRLAFFAHCYYSTMYVSVVSIFTVWSVIVGNLVMNITMNFFFSISVYCW